MWCIFQPPCDGCTWQVAQHHPVTNVAPTTTQLIRKPASNTDYLAMPGIHISQAQAEDCWFGKHKHCVSDQLQNSQHTHKCQMLSSQEKSSFIQLTPTSSENGENGAMLGHCYLGTFILITEALGNRCLVTNTFETDLLML